MGFGAPFGIAGKSGEDSWRSWSSGADVVDSLANEEEPVEEWNGVELKEGMVLDGWDTSARIEQNILYIVDSGGMPSRTFHMSNFWLRSAHASDACSPRSAAIAVRPQWGAFH